MESACPVCPATFQGMKRDGIILLLKDIEGGKGILGEATGLGGKPLMAVTFSR